MTIYQNTEKLFISKGHHFLIALLLFFQSSLCLANSPLKLDSLSVRQVWLAAHMLPGSGQIINKQFWKVPIFYAGMGSMLYMGFEANSKYKATVNEFNQPYYSPDEEYRFREKWMQFKAERNIYYVGAAAFYVASVADALIVQSKEKHSPLTATVLSALMPGMGQIYNQKLWKVPIIFGSFATLYYMVDFNQRGYSRFAKAYKDYPDHSLDRRYTEANLLFLRDAYRRNRDLSIIGVAAFYMLNIIDAYVDAHFFDWDISDNLAFNFEPFVFESVSAYRPGSNPSIGLRLNLNF